jgi:hypothetical protein
MARVEFLACKPEIEKLRSEGFSIAVIFEKLKENGKIAMGYNTFCKYIKGPIPKHKKPAPPAPLAQSAPVSSPGLLPAPRPQALPAGNLSEPGTPFVHRNKSDRNNPNFKP